MPSLAANLQHAPLLYSGVADANVSIIFTEASESFIAVRSPQVDASQASLLAFAEAAAFELEISLRSLPKLPDSISVRSSFICISLNDINVRSREN
jgi:hypothetical protein